MKIKLVVFFVLAVSLTGIAPGVHAEDDQMPANSKYVVIKGGYYSPSENFDINDFNGGAASHLETKKGFNGEIALGQYADEKTALELGTGFFVSRAYPSGEQGSATLKAIPLIVTAKGFVPFGAFQPYIELGLGGYFTKLEVSGNSGSFSSESKVTYGFHAGAGFDISLGDIIFLGLEGRYLWAKADYSGQPVKLNGLMTTLNLGVRY
jgi:opacity protein-like surface antigen